MSCEIRQSKLCVDAHIIGAAELVLAEIIADPGRTLTSADVVDGESAPTTATESLSY
jgi:hypothetical protein